MTSLMKESEIENLHAMLKMETGIIEEYIHHQEDMLIAYSNEPVVIEFLKNPADEEKRNLAQEHTKEYYDRLDNWEGLYIGEWDTHVIAHSSPEYIGMVTREEGAYRKQLQDAMTSRNGLYNAGIIVSPASEKLILSLYCPVYDYDGKTILGYVGGGPYVEALDELLHSAQDETTRHYMINVTSGIYIFAENKDLIATEIKDNMLLSIIKTLAAEKNLLNGSKEYVDELEGKSIAAYQYLPEYGWAVVAYNSEKNVYADVTTNMLILGVICIASDIMIGLLSWAFIRRSTKPLEYVEESIVQLKQLKLEKQHKLDKYINCESEIGQIATAIDSLYDSIKEMLEIEKEKQMAIAARQSQAKFLASMSHEIRTPINTIIGMNEMILRENQDEDIAEYAHNINSASRMLLGIINDVLDFSKIEAGKLQLVEKAYPVGTMINDVVLGITNRIKDKGLELKLEIDESIPSALMGDEIRIKQILNNLLSNAFKYTEKGRITFTVQGVQKEQDFGLKISVADTGIGIRQEDIEKLFDSFKRLEIEKNRHIQGTGLGLNITKQLIDTMNGTIEVQSEYGAGSCFTVWLPQQIVDETPMGNYEEACKHIREEQNKGKRVLYAPNANILVVDDNKMNLTVIQSLLKRTEIRLDCVTSGKECLNMTKNKKYDLILMDHMMPEMDGIQAFHILQNDDTNPNQKTAVVVLTANAIAGMAEEYLKEGFAGYFPKPITGDKLEEMIAKFVDGEFR
ncbi:MAG: response regulator [Lachnospiraceae bacterium]|nr:response regulator [Lachnospiraceae bacterium]